MTTAPQKVIWTAEREQLFREIMSSSNIRQKIMGLHFSCNNHASRENDICILTKCIVKALGPKINYKKKQKSRKKRWFDNECKIMRKELRKLGRQLFVNPDNHDIGNNYFRKKKMFQKMVKYKKREI